MIDLRPRYQLDLAGQNCVQRALARLREFEPPDGYALAFSGGKDSVCIKRLADMAGVKYAACYNVTTIDPPPVIRFMRREHPDVAFCKPLKYRGFVAAVRDNGLPNRRRRWCCKWFKEHDAEPGKVKVMGMRMAERRPSGRGQRAVELCARTGQRVVNPIFDWTDADVWGFIRSERVPYCKLYDQGWKRIGCICCPFASPAQKSRNLARWPFVFGQIRKAFTHWWTVRERPPELIGPMFAWWLGDMRGKSPASQWIREHKHGETP